MVLLIVDTQKLITNEELYNFNEFVVNVVKLIDTARKKYRSNICTTWWWNWLWINQG